MPLATFEKLSSCKKARLIHAAVDEFSRRPYERVSVFEIARRADISRGSFYYYFSDKEDLYCYLLDELRGDFLDSIPAEIRLLEFPDLVLDFFADLRETDRGKFVARMLEHTRIWAHDDFLQMRAPKRQPGQGIRIRGIEVLDALEGPDRQLLSFVFWECSCHYLSAYYRQEITREALHAEMKRVIELFHYGVDGKIRAEERIR